MEGRWVGVVSDVVRALGEELKWCWSDDERANRLEGVLGIVRAGMKMKTNEEVGNQKNGVCAKEGEQQRCRGYEERERDDG